jgi:hypothetical protein
MKPVSLIILAAVVALAGAAPAAAARPKNKSGDPLVEQVNKAIQNGIRYLRGKQLKDGSWEVDFFGKMRYQGGWTCLSMLALLNAGVPPNDKMIQRGLEYLRKLNTEYTYVRALQTMVFVEAGQTEDKERIQKNVDWLIKIRLRDGTKLMGWTYNSTQHQAADNSNTQYALLGLHAGRLAGAKIPDGIWQEIRDFYIRTQLPRGGWIYARHHNPNSYLTMDVAGACGLLIAGMELNKGREKFRGGRVENCGEYDEVTAVQKAIKYISQEQYAINFKDAVYYNLYGLERLGRLSGLRFFGTHDWYREGCKLLVSLQSTRQEDYGCWPSQGIKFDHWPLVNTSFALLFLSKGRTPVLISKMVHGTDAARKGASPDWNNDRNDIKNLTEFASRELFKRQPLAWQAFDAWQGIEGRPNTESPEEQEDKVAAELLQSPIAYFNGHKAPHFKDREYKVLRQFVNNGGFILAEACCSRKAFDRAMPEVVKEIFGDDAELTDLEPSHPVWSAFFKVKPGVFPLKGVKRGCKTVMIYSPTDLSCRWESNQYKDPRFDDGRGILAFRLGANIIAYATGLEKPKPRLTEQTLINPKNEKSFVRRHYLQVAQLKHAGEWEPAPKAMAILMDHLAQEAALNTDKRKKPIAINDKNIVDYKFLYMHGNRGFSLKKMGLEDKDLKLLRFNLTTGGLLLADACCGSEEFDASFRAFVKELFPKARLERIPVDKDELFSKELNGEKLDASNIRARIKRSSGKEGEAQYRSMAPELEGIKIDNRWVVIYSKYDIGCALEKAQSTNCLGYDHPSALKLAKAAVLYALKR